MSTPTTIQDELNELNSHLPSGQNGTPFMVPQGYFEGLADAVMAKIKSEELLTANAEILQLSPLLAGISRQMPYNIPENFFEENLEFLPAITTENAESSLLSSIEKEMPYQLPQGYFDQLPDQILNKVSRPVAKIIPITRRKWMRLAVAAVTVGIIVLSGIFYFNGRKDITVDNPQWIAKKLKNVSDHEIEEFVKTAPITSTSTATAQFTPAKATDVKAMLKDVSDKELDAFLQQVPADNEDEDLLNN